MGGVRNGKSAGTPEPAAAPQGAPQPGAPDAKPAEDASGAVDRHLRSAVRLLREDSAARAFGELARATRTLPMTPRLAAALVRFSLLAGTEAAAIALLDAVPAAAAPEVRHAVHRQLARVLRRVGQAPRAIAALEAVLAERPGDRRARRALQALRAQEVTDGRREAPGEPAPVLGKLPTRKAGVQAPAVWEEEDSGYRVETVVEPPEGVPTDTQPSVPREPTAVAFPALSPAREAEPPSPESRTRTEIELPAVGAALRDTAPDLEALTPEFRSRTETELPVPDVARVAPASAPRSKAEDEAEPRKTDAARMPSASAPRSKAEDEAEPRRTDVARAPAASAPRSKAEDEAEPRKTEVELPALGRATDETTGEITSETPPVPPASPVDTQELSAGDLEAALQRSRSASPSRAESPRTAEVPWPGPPSRSPGPRADVEDAEELARSQKLEAQLIARQAWRELAQLYLKRADRARDASVRAEALTRLAEVMENELQDPAGAARMYREIVELTGDRAALREQVRLLGARGDPSVVRRALDDAIRRARTDRARAGALLTRGERWLFMNEPRKAREDFEAANALAPGLLPVLVGLFRCASDAERPAATERLRAALATAPRRSPDRLEGLRVLAQAAEEPQGDARLAQWAWSEVLAESPGNEQAQGKLLALARRLEDTPALRDHLRAQLSREPRGPAARQARLELVASLDARGDEEGALSELRQAVRYEPGHKEAWLLLVERLTARGNMGEAAWALEHAATSMEDERERERTWERLARLWREVLGNPERAQVFARRAESLRQAREEREPSPPPEPPRAAPLVPPPPALSLDTAAIEGLADEVTSNTDPIASPLVARGERTVPGAPVPEEPAAASEQGGKAAKARGAPAPARGKKPGQPARADAPVDGAAPKGAAPEGERPSAPSGDGASTNPPGAAAARGAASVGAMPPGSPFAPTPKLERAMPPASTGASASKSVLPASSGVPAGASSAPTAKAERAGGPTAKGERATLPAPSKGERAAPAVPSAPAAKAPASTGPAAAGLTAKADRASPPASAGPASAASAAPGAKADRAGSPASAGPASGASPAPGAKADRAAPTAGAAAASVPSAPAKADRAAPSAGAAAASTPSAPPVKADWAVPPAGAAAASPPAAPSAKAAPPAGAAAASPPAAPSAKAAPPAAASAPSPRAERPAAPGSRAQRPGSPSDAAPARPDKAAASSRPAQPAGDAELSLTGARARVASRKPEDPAPGEEDMDLEDEHPVPGTRLISWEAPPGRMDPVRRIVRSRQEGPAPAAQGRTFFGKAPEPPVRPGAAETRESPIVSEAPAPSDAEPDALRLIRERPLDPKPYRQLTELFDSQGDTARASLMREIADALEGRESPAPRIQRPPLSTEERAGLRHPGLRTPSGELLACAGIALCRLFPAQGRAASALEPLRGSSGPGAPAVLEALNASGRLLDVHLPELVLSDDDGPHFTAVHASTPRLLVGRLAVRQALPAGELRFHAGRALLSLSPDLLALRTLKGAQLLRALALLTTVLKDPRASGQEARVVREALSPRALERALALLEPGTRDFDASALADAARDSANRAGLVACGSLGPAVAALRTRRSHDAELVELLRFAASERYLPLRAPR